MSTSAVTGWTLLALLLLGLGPAAATEMRTALVLGNGAYQQGALPNPVNDARDMAKALRGAGFKVLLGTNLDHRKMKRKLREFARHTLYGQPLPRMRAVLDTTAENDLQTTKGAAWYG